MYLDKELQFLDNVAVTASVDSDVIDTGNLAFGDANELMEVMAKVTEDFAADGAATLQLAINASATSDMASPVPIYDSGAIGKADLVKGYKFSIGKKLPDAHPRYLQAQVTVATGPMTAGKLTVGFVPNSQTAGASFAALTDF